MSFGTLKEELGATLDYWNEAEGPKSPAAKKTAVAIRLTISILHVFLH